jgi:hypothetical protein
VYLRLLLRPKFWESIGTSKKKLLKRFKASMQPLRLFAKPFKFAWPRIHLLEGLGALAEGRPLQEATVHWESGLKSAQALSMAAELSTLEKHVAKAVTKEAASLLSSSSLLVVQHDTGTPNPRRASTKRSGQERKCNSGPSKGKHPEPSEEDE